MESNALPSSLEEILIVPYSHHDFAWTNTRAWHIWRYLEGFVEVLDLMKTNQDFTWLIDNVAHSLIPFIRYCPERVEEFKSRIREGRIYIANGGYSLARPTYVGEETYIRNIVEGKRFFKEFSGVEEIDFLFNADTSAGHSQLPQILKLSGHKFYRFMRPESALNHKKIPKQFVWKGLDGSEVIVSRGSYGGFMYGHYTNKDFNAEWDEIKDAFIKEELKDQGHLELLSAGTLMLHYGCDDFRPLYNLFDEPIRLLEFIEEWNKREKIPLRFSTPGEYFSRLSTYDLPHYEGVLEQAELSFNTPVKGEHSMWRMRSLLDRLIVKAESLSSFASLLGMEYPDKAIASLWTQLFEITGHAIELVLSQDRDSLYSIAEGAVSTAQGLIKEACEYVASRTGNSEGEQYILLNTLNWPRSEVVKLHITSPFGVNGFDLVDGDGNRYDYQVTEIYTGDKSYHGCEYNAIDIAVRVELPPMGYKVLKTVKNSSRVSDSIDLRFIDSSPAGSGDSPELVRIDNGCFEVVFEKGRIRSIQQKGSSLTMNSGDGLKEINCLRFTRTEPTEDWISSWKTEEECTFIPESWEVLKNGPMQWVYQVKGKIGEHLSEQTMTINKGERAVNFDVTIDSKGGNGYFTAGFPYDPDTSLHVDIPFGIEERDLSVELLNMDKECRDMANLAEQGWKGQFYGKTWAAFKSSDIPAAIVSGNCSIYYHQDPVNHTMSILLNRLLPLDTKSDDKVYRWIKQTHSSIEGEGRHGFSYSFFFPERPGSYTDVAKFSKQKAHPMNAVPKFNRWTGGDGSMCRSFVSTDMQNVVVSAFHKEPGGYLFRMYEAEGRQTVLRVHAGFGYKKAVTVDFMGAEIESDLNADPSENGALQLTLQPWQIATIRFMV